MSSQAQKRWGIYASVFVFALLCIPALVLAQRSGIEPPVDGPTESGGLIDCDIDCNFQDLIALIQRVINFLIFKISVPIATVLFMWAGFKYLTAAGDLGKVKAAHSIFKNVATGLIIALGAWLFVNLLVQAFTTYDNATDVF